MAINLASKYSKKVDERFKLGSLTEVGINKDYDWAGVDTINIYSIPTAPMNDYTKSGSSRYGTPNDLGNEVQTMALTKDRSFTFTIDRRDADSTMMTMQAGKALARQIDEKVIPEIDAYRLSVMAAAAVSNGGTATGAVSKTNAYEVFLAGNEYLDENKVPLASRIAFVTPKFYNSIKLDDSFIKSTDIAQKMLVKGQVGEIDGVKIIKVPSVYLPANTSFVLCHPCATVGAEKLESYKIHDNPPGINGYLVEGRKIYDAFVLNNKKDALYTHKTA